MDRTGVWLDLKGKSVAFALGNRPLTKNKKKSSLKEKGQHSSWNTIHHPTYLHMQRHPTAQNKNLQFILQLKASMDSPRLNSNIISLHFPKWSLCSSQSNLYPLTFSPLCLSFYHFPARNAPSLLQSHFPALLFWPILTQNTNSH